MFQQHSSRMLFVAGTSRRRSSKDPVKCCIAQPVNALARFMTTANSQFYVLAKRVLRYLKGVQSREIIWCASRVKFPFVSCEIFAYSVASWADIVPQRKSSLSYLIFYNNAVFSWKSSLSLYLLCHLQKLN